MKYLANYKEEHIASDQNRKPLDDFKGENDDQTSEISRNPKQT